MFPGEEEFASWPVRQFASSPVGRFADAVGWALARRGKGKLSRDNDNNRQEWTRQMRLASLAVAIPTILGGSPVVGALLGRWLGGLIGHAGAGTVVGLVIGFIAGVRETVRLIRYLQKQTKS